MDNRAIGILDSGIGGLTVAREIVRLLPQEDIVYIGDRKNAPYGVRSKNEILDLSRRMVDFLIGKNVKAIVAACNTITVNCLDDLRKEYTGTPIIGTVPVVKTAVKTTRNRRIGILSTKATADSRYQKELIAKFAGDCVVVSIGTDKLVPLIEKGDVEGSGFLPVLNDVLRIFKEKEVDTLALGCTHFPYIRAQIQKHLGKDVEVLDSGEAIARQVRRVLEANRTFGTKRKVKYEFYFSGDTNLPGVMIRRFWGTDISKKIIFVNKF